MTGINDLLNQLLDQNPFLSYSEALCTCLRNEIILLHLKPGDTINESKLSSQLNISRSPIKMALDTLVSEGFIVRPKGKMAVVSNLSQKDYHDIMEARIAIESQAAYLAAKKITDKELSQLKILLKKFDLSAKNSDSSLFEQCDFHFHKIIVQTARNPYLLNMHQLIEPKLCRYRNCLVTVYSEHGPRYGTPTHHHIAVYNALSSHFSSIAQDEMIKDISRMNRNIGLIPDSE